MRKALLGLLIAGVVAAGARVAAEDWPEWRGRGRLGVWTETGLLEKFPDTGLRVAWRTAIHGGYAGPAVAGGRVFVTDVRRVSGSRMIERAVALDEANGRILWTREWEADYSGLETIFAVGPRATPTVDGNRVYVIGTMGDLLALDVGDGRVLWQKDFVKDFDASVPSWGMTSAPLVDGDRLIAVVGGEPNAKVMAFDKLTGDEIWRALSSDWEPGYNQPIIIEAARTRQLIIWHPRAVSSLNPATGAVYWEVPYEVDLGMTVATPVHSGAYLLVSSFYNSARMLKLDEAAPAAALAWRGDNESISALIATPVIDGKYIYGMSSGELACWELETGKTSLALARADQGADGILHRVHRPQRRPLFHQHRTRRPGDRPPFASRVQGDQPRDIDRADASERAPAGSRADSLVASGLREPAHLRQKRQGNPQGVARQRVAVSMSRAGGVAIAAFTTLAVTGVGVGSDRQDRPHFGTPPTSFLSRLLRPAALQAETGRLTVIISDLHLGPGRDPAGAWQPTEDFRWADAFGSFLRAINDAGKGATDSCSTATRSSCGSRSGPSADIPMCAGVARKRKR